jgi:hypothetical protein
MTLAWIREGFREASRGQFAPPGAARTDTCAGSGER